MDNPCKSSKDISSPGIHKELRKRLMFFISEFSARNLGLRGLPKRMTCRKISEILKKDPKFILELTMQKLTQLILNKLRETTNLAKPSTIEFIEELLNSKITSLNSNVIDFYQENCYDVKFFLNVLCS